MPLYKYLFLFLRVLVHFNVVLLTDQINVGTVLFTKKDSARKCWNDEQIALLRARLIFQDILPKTNVTDLKNDESLNALVCYFRSAIEKVQQASDGVAQRLNLMAICDVLGGYCRSILVPLTKRAFYCGTLNYETTENVAKFYADMKAFLHTDGRNWAPPSAPISCRFTEQQPPVSEKSGGDSCDQINYTNDCGRIDIATPYLDSKRAPTAIVIAFKESPVRNLDHKNALNCVSDFFVVAKECLREKCATEENIRKFDRDFEGFLDTEVFPHLKDDKIYGAFGGVFRIKNDLNRTRDLFLIDKRTINATRKRKTDGIAAAMRDDDDEAPVIVLVCLCAVTALWLCITLYYCAKNRRNQSVSKRKSEPSITKIPPETEKPKKFSQNIEEKCTVCARNAPQSGPKACPKCKRKHCRCVKNIWSTLSNHSITYPRIFSKKCATEHAHSHFMVQMASVIPKAPARTIKSAPVTAGKQWRSESANQSEINEKVFVFGYDFETSSSDDSSFTDDASSGTL